MFTFQMLLEEEGCLDDCSKYVYSVYMTAREDALNCNGSRHPQN